MTKTANKYAWRIESFGKGIDPDAAIKEIEKVEATYGSLTPENLIKASEGKRSILHKLFEWDDNKAAHQYRLQQARNLINNIEIIVVSDGKQRTMPAFEIISLPANSGRAYKQVIDMDLNEIEQVRESVKRDIAYLKNKLQNYTEFRDVTASLDSVMSELGKVKTEKATK